MKKQFAAALAACTLSAGLLTAAPEAYNVDTVHSFILFKIKHFNVGNAYGQFKDFKGTIQYDKEAPEKSSIELTIDANSVDTRNPKRDDHVKSPDLMNAKQYPSITFKSDSLKKTSDTTFDLAGQMTFHGVTKPVTAKLEKIGEAKDPKGTERLGTEAIFTFKRSDFGMTGMMQGLGDDVTVTIALEAIKAGAPAAQ